MKNIEKNTSPIGLIGMIHLQAMPGTPKNKLNPAQIIEHAIHEAAIYQKHGIHSLMIENMHDVPYLKSEAPSEVIALMAIIGHELKRRFPITLGIQLLAGANIEALAVACAADLDFIRAEGFVFGHLADEGYMDSCAGKLLRYRKQMGAEKVAIYTDVKKKHSSHSITSDTSIVETAKAAAFFLSDGIIVTGTSTGMEPLLEEVKAVKESVNLPIIIGSGITKNNLSTFAPFADGFIVGSAFKRNSKWFNELDEIAIEGFMKSFSGLNTYK